MCERHFFPPYKKNHYCLPTPSRESRLFQSARCGKKRSINTCRFFTSENKKKTGAEGCAFRQCEQKIHQLQGQVHLRPPAVTSEWGQLTATGLQGADTERTVSEGSPLSASRGGSAFNIDVSPRSHFARHHYFAHVISDLKSR